MVKVYAPLGALLFANWANALWPIPAYYTYGNDTVWLSPEVQLVFDAPRLNCVANRSEIYVHGQIPSAGSDDGKVYDAWARTKNFLFKENFVPWKFHPRGTKFEPARDAGTVIRTVHITQLEADTTATPEYGEIDESYNLTIPSASDQAWYNVTSGETDSSTIYISAVSSYGVLHGLTTLSQLFYGTKANKGAVYSTLAPVEIIDKPKFVHRGLNLDVSRQWYPKEAILKTIDALSWNKMNRLHLHATDAQSWPLEIPAMPELAEKGSYADGLTYTPEDLQDILTHAEQRGIQVIVEIDMPGHTTSIAESHPELITGKNIQPDWDTYAAQPPSGSLKLNNADVEAFLEKLFADLLPRLRDHTVYFHTGGDEVNKNVYNHDEGINSNETSVLKPALQNFFDYVHAQVKKHDMSPLVWEEMIVDWELQLAENTIVQTWISDASTKTAVEKGYRVITGNYNFWYLDCGNGQWLDFGPARYAEFYPFNDYCSPKKSWRLVYSFDPIAGLTEEEAKLILGGEVHIWSEQIDAVNLDSTLWPRGSAAAEVLWSGRTDANGVNRTFADASPRLAEFRERMVARGVGASPIMQLWCHQNLGGCALN
ncbi:Glucosamine-6-phosphate isomerase (Glucosamine-6-phosphate deaminase) (GNPDA) (GlcN6P deaminase) [Rhizina undulata]